MAVFKAGDLIGCNSNLHIEYHIQPRWGWHFSLILPSVSPMAIHIEALWASIQQVLVLFLCEDLKCAQL